VTTTKLVLVIQVVDSFQSVLVAAASTSSNIALNGAPNPLALLTLVLSIDIIKCYHLFLSLYSEDIHHPGIYLLSVLRFDARMVNRLSLQQNLNAWHGDFVQESKHGIGPTYEDRCLSGKK
jgi:hypothetical protein